MSKSENEKILIDGRNRFSIYSEEDIAFIVRAFEFKTIEKAKDWMVDNQ